LGTKKKYEHLLEIGFVVTSALMMLWIVSGYKNGKKQTEKRRWPSRIILSAAAASSSATARTAYAT